MSSHFLFKKNIKNNQELKHAKWVKTFTQVFFFWIAQLRLYFLSYGKYENDDKDNDVEENKINKEKKVSGMVNA